MKYKGSDNQNIKSLPILLPECELESIFSEYYLLKIDLDKFKHIMSNGLLPLYSYNGQGFVLKNDIESVLASIVVSKYRNVIRPRHLDLFKLEDVQSVKVGNSTVIDLGCDDTTSDPTFFSATRNLISFDNNNDLSNSSMTEVSTPYFAGCSILTVCDKITGFAKKQVLRSQQVDIAATSQFARSAHYMGSKRQLCGFLIEAISSVLPDSGAIVDLMCGSGVVAGAFSRVWDTFASDAQIFSRTLAVVHGGGFDREKANDLISRLLPFARQHFDDLQLQVSTELEIEDDLFCREINDSLRTEYHKFITDFPTLTKGGQAETWNPVDEVFHRRIDPSKYPFCLFTAYFSNIYFGLRQCVEIDSLRFAIEQIEDQFEKNWALGALVATLSALGTTYSGHFAQPVSMDIENASYSKLSSIISKRSFSITHEFTVRLLNLSDNSQNAINPIEVVPGPWELSLSTLSETLHGRQVLVYLDAPYTRDEYSRYYHVLETLVHYNYPSCTGKGLTPMPGERFRSDFFTKNQGKLVNTLTNVITNILNKGWMCAWSYSDSGAASVYEVIDSVYKKSSCNVKSYSVPFVHKSQGGALPKRVTEYLIIFSP